MGGFCFVHKLEDTHIRPASKPEDPQKEKVKVRQAHIVMKKLVRCADSMDTWCVEMRQCARGVSLAFHMSIGIPPEPGMHQACIWMQQPWRRRRPGRERIQVTAA